MDQKQGPTDDETMARFQRMANRQTEITMASVVVAMCIGNAVSEAMMAQSFWLRLLAVGASSAFAAGIIGALAEKYWRKRVA